MIPGIFSQINRFFFFPASLRNLAVLRIIFFGSLLFWQLFGRLKFPAIAATDKILEPLWHPGEMFRLLHLKFPSVAEVQITGAIYTVSLVCSILGWQTRIFTKIACVSGWYCINLPYQFGFQPHYLSPHLLILIIFAFAPCADALSLDSWRRPPALPSERYSWPVRCGWVVWVGIFFSAGVTKIKNSGLSWATEGHINSVFQAHIRFFDYEGFEFLHAFPALFVKYCPFPEIIGIGVFIQLSTIFVFFLPWARKYIVGAMAVMQFFIWLLMALRHFWFYLPIYAFFIDWDKKIPHQRTSI